MEDQDTVKKIDQGSKTQLLFFQVSNRLCTQRMTISFFFFKSSTLPSLIENVDLFVNRHVFLDYRWIRFIVAHSEKKKSWCFTDSQSQNDFMLANCLS